MYRTATPLLLHLNAAAFLVACGLLWLSLRRGRLSSVDIYVSKQVLVHSMTLILASTLSLMLKNLARHFDDEAFREDAMETMSSTSNVLLLLTRSIDGGAFGVRRRVEAQNGACARNR